jgi:hypothetical protein
MPLSQPPVHFAFQYRPAVARSKTFAVDNADAGVAAQFTCADKFVQRAFGFRNCHAVQVDLVLHAEIAACELAHGSPADGRPMKTQGFAGTGFRFIDIGVQAFLQCFAFILAGKTRSRTDLRTLLRCRLRLAQWLGVAHQAPKQADLIMRGRIGVFLSAHREYPD